MTANGWLQIACFLLAVFLVTPLLGGFMARVFTRQRTWLDPVCRPIERFVYRLTGVDEAHEMRWTEYAASLILFSAVSMFALYAMQRLQPVLPFNPQRFGGVAPDLAFNTAASFTTNTNWQAYSGESAMSYFTQMAGLAYQNFVSAAAGIAVAIAFIRGIAQKEKDTLGNFWVDLVRATLWVLLPIAIVGSLFLVSQGVVQNLKGYDTAAVVDPQTATALDGSGIPRTTVVIAQTIAQGPVASQEIIKQFGTNGGGFFNANSAHPFENPTPLSNFVAMLGIFAISSGLTYTLGSMTGSRGHGWAVWAAMAFLFVAGVTVAYWAEARGNPMLTRAGADQSATTLQPGGNMEGKEVRFGIANTALFATATTDASCGAVNGWHDSFTPLGGLVPLANIQLSEVVFGGVGAGMYGILVYIILAVFIAGLMVGRTPEYLGKKIQAFEVQMAMLTVLVFSLLILTFTAISSVSPGFGTSSIANAGPHGLSEMLYAYSSAAANNGSAFGGISVNTGVVQHHARPRDAVRPVLHDRPAAGDCRQPRTQEADSSLTRNVSGHHAALHRPAGGRRPDRRCLDLLSRSQPRPGGRALHDERRAGVLMAAQKASVWDTQIVGRAIADSIRKLHPRVMARNPVMFVVEIGSVLTTLRLVADAGSGGGDIGFEVQITVWLWLTVLFANFAEAMAEGRGKAQADTLRRAKTETVANRELPDRTYETVPAPSLRKGDIVRVAAGGVIPADGDMIEGVASVDESAITGESAPVIRESGGDRSAVTGGTKVLSDWIRVAVTVNPGETFLDRMIALVEGAERQKTPNEIALNILLAGLTIVFLIAVVTLQPFAIYSHAPQIGLRAGVAAGLPDSHDDRRAAVGNRHRRHGPPGAAQRARDVGTCGGSGRRRAHAAARQDRHDHAGQPASGRVHPAAGRQRGDARRCRAARVAAGRDARGPLDRRAGEGEVRPPRARAVAGAGDVRAVHGADADVGCRPACGRLARSAPAAWRWR